MYDEILKQIRKDILEIAHLGGDGNLQSTFSSLDLIWCIYDKILDITPNNCYEADRDIFILSKGQASLGLFVILSEKGFFSKKELKRFCKHDSIFGMQGDKTRIKGLEVSAGSLGHGLPIAVGVAMANKLKKINSKVCVLCGDGEMNEGTMWEALILASHNKLDNLYIVIDDNKSILKMLEMGDLKEKMDAFGIDSIRINGHNQKEIISAFAEKKNGRPKAIIANTQRGYGSKTLMEDPSWFHRAPTKDELEMLIKEVAVFETTND